MYWEMPLALGKQEMPLGRAPSHRRLDQRRRCLLRRYAPVIRTWLQQFPLFCLLFHLFRTPSHPESQSCVCVWQVPVLRVCVNLDALPGLVSLLLCLECCTGFVL